MSRIVDVKGREVIDSRGNPTVEAEVFLASGALNGPMRRRDLGPNGRELLRAAYGRALERVLDGLRSRPRAAQTAET